MRRAELQAEAGQHTEKGAVHERAFGQIEHKTGEAFLKETIDQGFKIDAGVKAGPASDFDAGIFIPHPNQKSGSGHFHNHI